MRRQRALMAVVALAMWAGGCAHPRSCCPCSTAAGSAALNESLPAVERSTIVADTSAIGSLAEVDRALGRPTGGAPYYALTAGDCQCRAAAQSSLGNLLDGERRIVCSRQGHKMSAGDAVRLRALSAAAQEARNRSASQALQLYYSLAEVEVQLDLAQQGEDELAADMRRVREMRQQGLEVPFDDSDYTRRLAELRSRRIDAEVSRSRANHDLRRLLGMPSDDWTARLWPSTPLIVTVEPIDMQEAVSTALALSPELRGLRQLTGSADDQTLAAIGDVLQSVNGLLGTQADHCSILCGLAAKLHTSAAEVQLRRQQLYQYTLQREQEITEQVRNAASEVGERLRQI
ncbi:MAG TPA: hypothetical protein VHY20_03780, partial [Pirellulales bacterium]|nr:hypothetical protein [Pirellulales bacterium]